MARVELERSIELQDSWFEWAEVEPLFDPIRDDPRFKVRVKQMDLPE